jgi:phosphotransferase system HPr-like phosphotransfer protein
MFFLRFEQGRTAPFVIPAEAGIHSRSAGRITKT